MHAFSVYLHLPLHTISLLSQFPHACISFLLRFPMHTFSLYPHFPQKRVQRCFFTVEVSQISRRILKYAQILLCQAQIKVLIFTQFIILCIYGQGLCYVQYISACMYGYLVCTRTYTCLPVHEVEQYKQYTHYFPIHTCSLNPPFVFLRDFCFYARLSFVC